MREVTVTMNFCGEIITAHMKVRAEYLTTPHGKTQLKNLLECNAQVLEIRECTTA
jgi:hypothetical protein